MNIVAITIACIDVGDRLRSVDEDYARLIAASMAADGQRTPIEVRAAGKDGRHRLIAGGHRVRAAEIAGLATLQAVVLDVGELDAQRLEIEENLCRHELTELDRSTFLARWKHVYEALNSGAKHGGKRRGVSSRQVGDLKNIERFTAIAADKLGLSERVIQRAALRFKHIAPDVRAAISGTWMALRGADLDYLARLKPDMQRKVVGLMREQPAILSLAQLHHQAAGIRLPSPDVDQAQFDALVKLWRKTGAKARRRFEAELAKDAQFDLGERA